MPFPVGMLAKREGNGDLAALAAGRAEAKMLVYVKASVPNMLQGPSLSWRIPVIVWERNVKETARLL